MRNNRTKVSRMSFSLLPLCMVTLKGKIDLRNKKGLINEKYSFADQLDRHLQSIIRKEELSLLEVTKDLMERCQSKQTELDACRNILEKTNIEANVKRVNAKVQVLSAEIRNLNAKIEIEEKIVEKRIERYRVIEAEYKVAYLRGGEVIKHEDTL